MSLADSAFIMRSCVAGNLSASDLWMSRRSIILNLQFGPPYIFQKN